ncbi:GRF1-interacting factor 2-like [Actinidia eriantha]|uniref:GRF1-interacting factor 2-like n=1 Tax=Actinidia eriantha TaxID=165200 RepID=UPI00258CD81E|nr:GRF1-interacting factor 2-like [Actinidia eriantha]
MQQQLPQPMTTPPLFPSIPTNITTEDIQKSLNENKRLILAIMENQSLGKVAECAQYQAQLQKNLMDLAAIADAQPQAPTMPSQTPLQSVVQQEPHIQPPGPATVAQEQHTGWTPRLPFQVNTLQSGDQHQPLLQQQQLIQGQVGLGPGANTSTHQFLQTGIGTSGILQSNLDLLGTGSSEDRDSQL